MQGNLSTRKVEIPDQDQAWHGDAKCRWIPVFAETNNVILTLQGVYNSQGSLSSDSLDKFVFWARIS